MRLFDLFMHLTDSLTVMSQSNEDLWKSEMAVEMAFGDILQMWLNCFFVANLL